MRAVRGLLLLGCCTLAVGCGGNNGAPNAAPQRPRYYFAEKKSDAPGAAQQIVETADPTAAPDQGQGPGRQGDSFDRIVENAFQRVMDEPLSTFSIDVDTASYAICRRYLQQNNLLPPPDAVRIEEFVNYFRYDYAAPDGDDAFLANVEVAGCPWNARHRLVRIGLKGKEVQADHRPSSNLVFLLDVSGSMNEQRKLPLMKNALRLLVDQLDENDRVAIVVYAGAAGQVLPSTPGNQKSEILNALGHLHAGGSTAGAAGIELAYQVAAKHFITGGVNRVILCTDGDFNVGPTGAGELERLIEEQARTGVYLSIMGFGCGNLQDGRMEQLSNKGNGNYAYLDTLAEARRVFVEQMSATLVTIAKDVKIQVEFNPAQVGAYRLIGYENRMLAAGDFHDDRKDAGEIGAAHTVTALYELVPPAAVAQLEIAPPVDALKYQPPLDPSPGADSGELMTLKLRYKQPDADSSRLLTFSIRDRGQTFAQASRDFQFASAVAAFAMVLRHSRFSGDATLETVRHIAADSAGTDADGDRTQFLALVNRAQQISRRR